MAMLLIASDVLPPLVRVADCGALVDPTLTEPKARLVGLAVMVFEAEVPVPVSVTCCGLVLSLSVNVRVAARPPVAVGAKMMFAVQLAEAASVAPQVFEYIWKSPGLAPPMAMPLMETAVLSELVRVTTF
jgi:hypothetical protein